MREVDRRDAIRFIHYRVPVPKQIIISRRIDKWLVRKWLDVESRWPRDPMISLLRVRFWFLLIISEQYNYIEYNFLNVKRSIFLSFFSSEIFNFEISYEWECTTVKVISKNKFRVVIILN